MNTIKRRYFPKIGEAIHLLVLYVVLQSLVDFPLALLDYQNGTSYSSIPWINITSNVLILGFIFWFSFRKAGTSFKKLFAIRTFNPLILLAAIIILPGLQYLVGFINIEIEKIIPAPPWFWEMFQKIFDNRFGFWGVIVKVAIIAPIIEEAIFRGIIMHGFMRNYKPWIAVIMSALLFSIFHMNPWQMSYTFVLGLLLGWIMNRTRSLPLCILIHSANNLWVALSITYAEKINEIIPLDLQQTEWIYISSLSILLGMILIVLFSLKRKTKHKQKFTE